MKRLYIAASAILCAFVVSTILVSAQPAGPTIVNGALDEPYTRRGADEVMIAHGWSDPVWRGRRPECKPSDLARSGESQKCVVRFDDLKFAIGQQPQNIEAGDWVRVIGWAYPWSSQKDDVTRCQNSAGDDVNFGKLAARVCVNWWGADPFEEPYSTACSVQALQCGEWNKLELVVQVQTSNAKIWLLTESRVKASHQDVWWDDVTIEKVSGPVGPTSTPYPTPQPCPTCAPGSGCSCTAVQSIVETAVVRIETAIDDRDPVRWP